MPYHAYHAVYEATPTNHHAIYIESDTDKFTFLFQVVGSLYQGMSFMHKPAQELRESDDFLECHYLGTITEGNYVLVQSTVETIPPPHKQMRQGGLIDRSQPAVLSKEWTEAAILALKMAGILDLADGE